MQEIKCRRHKYKGNVNASKLSVGSKEAIFLKSIK